MVPDIAHNISKKALSLLSDGNSLRSVGKKLCIQSMYLCPYIKKQNSNKEERKRGRSRAFAG